MQALVIISIVLLVLGYISYRMLTDNKTYGWEEPTAEEILDSIQTPKFRYPKTDNNDYKSIDLQLKRYAYNYQDYLDYLKTKQWKEKKWLRFVLDRGKCQECGIKLEFKQSHCHHKSYNWLYEEPLEDLETLCRYCHIEIRHSGKQQES